jgi:hypothetical protein
MIRPEKTGNALYALTFMISCARKRSILEVEGELVKEVTSRLKFDFGLFLERFASRVYFSSAFVD